MEEFVPTKKTKQKISEDDIKKVKELISYVKRLDEEYVNKNKIESDISDVINMLIHEECYQSELVNKNDAFPEIIKLSFKKVSEFIKSEMNYLKNNLMDGENLREEFKEEIINNIKKPSYKKRNYYNGY